MKLNKFNTPKHCAATKNIIIEMQTVRDHYKLCEGTMFEMTPTLQKIEEQAKEIVKRQHDRPKKRGFVVPSTFKVEVDHKHGFVEILKNYPDNRAKSYPVLIVTL